MSSSHLSAQLNESSQHSDTEIDLRQVAAAIVRKKILIASITVAASLISGLYAFTRKPVWEGSFQIVLENQDNSLLGGRLAQLAASNPMLANLAGLNDGVNESSLETEVAILQSPSILSPYTTLLNRAKPLKEDISEWITQTGPKTIYLSSLSRAHLS